MDKYIWTVIAPDETVALRVIERFDPALHLTFSLPYFLSFQELIHGLTHQRRNRGQRLS
jgi:hypothetical protein